MSVNYLPDFDTINNPNDVITDLVYDRYNTKYQLSDFKNLKVIGDPLVHKKDLDRSPKFKLFWDQNTKEGLDEFAQAMFEYYRDLDTNLKRLLDNYNDPMFIRFICKIGALKSQKNWELLLRNWNLGYSDAIRRYYNAAHQNYQADALSYLSYFDMFFSNYLYYAIGRSDQFLAERHGINSVTSQCVRFDGIKNEDSPHMNELVVF